LVQQLPGARALPASGQAALITDGAEGETNSIEGAVGLRPANPSSTEPRGMPARAVIVGRLDVVGIDGSVLPVMSQGAGGAGDMPPPSNIGPVEPLAGEQPKKRRRLMPGAGSSIAPSGMPDWRIDACDPVASGVVPWNDGSPMPVWARVLPVSRALANKEMAQTSLFITSPRQFQRPGMGRGT
jgi:hypothetical protein